MGFDPFYCFYDCDAVHNTLYTILYYRLYKLKSIYFYNCTGYCCTASVVWFEEVLSEPYDDGEMGLGVWHPYCIYFDRGLIEWLSYYVY